MLRWFVAPLTSIVLLSSCAGSGSPLGDIEIARGVNFVAIAEKDRVAAPSIAGDSLREGEAPVTDAFVAGRVAVVNFWGSWCGPCRKEAPILERAHRDYGEDVAFLGINTRRDQRAAAIAFLDEFDVTHPSVYDPNSELAYRFGVRVMPATFILDAEGRIAVSIIGAVRSIDELRARIDEVSR